MRKATSGMVQALKSGEGLVLDFQGPGRVVTQSRNPTGLINWIQSVIAGQPRVRHEPTSCLLAVALCCSGWLHGWLGRRAASPDRFAEHERSQFAMAWLATTTNSLSGASAMSSTAPAQCPARLRGSVRQDH